MSSRGHWQTRRTPAVSQSLIAASFCVLCVIAGLWTPFPVQASAQLIGFGVTPTGPGSSGSNAAAIPTGAATPPAIYNEPLPAANAYSDSVGATPATYRTDESGSATYSVGLYVAPGTAGLAPALSLEYNSRGANGPLGPGWTLGGLSAIARCKKATEFGDGAGPFPSINFNGVATDQAYCLDGARLLDLNNGASSCPAGQTGDTAHEFGLELDPSNRVCGYTKPANSDPTKVVIGYAYWLALPKDGTYRVYGTGGNAALIHNDGQGNADTQNKQYLSWALNRIADTTGNTIELTYNQTASTGEMDIAEVDYTGKIAISDVLKAAPTFTRATYANVKFNYVTLPAASQRIDYISGMKLALTQQLTTIVAQGPQNNGTTPTTLQTVRTYHLNYGTPTASALSALTSLKECAPNGTGEVCYPSTKFTWNFLGTHPIGYPTAGTARTYAGLQYSIDYKVGDVDGDGRQDLIWVKDQTCDSSGSGSTRFQIMVSLANSTGFAAPIASGVYITRPPQIGQSGLPACGADWRGFHFDTLWFLYDFSGDGRDDLLASNGTTWNIYQSIAKTGGYSFDGANPVATGMTSGSDDDGIFADINGDGLPDLIHENSVGGITANVLQHASSGLVFQFGATNYNISPSLPTGGTDYLLGFAPQPGRNVLNADLNGDGASDFVFQVVEDNGTCGGGGGNSAQRPGGTTAQGVTYHFLPSSQPDAVGCPTFWYTFRNTGLTGGTTPLFNLSYETNIGQIGGATGLPKDGSFISLADLNGDGQADIVYARNSGTNLAYYYRLNAGKSGDAATTERFLPEQSTGLTLALNFAEHVQFLDANGDHRADIVYQDSTSDSSGTFPLKAMLWGATSAAGFGSPVDIGNSTLNARNPTTTQTFYIDVDGNGGPDFVSLAGTSLTVHGYAPTFGGNDFITGIVNGLGASSFLNYYPLAYTSGYTRAYDGPGQPWGRSSPVFDVFSSIWVVHEASSSAPLTGAPTALSSVIYRYAGAKIQAGGRGFLGFSSVQAENQQPTQDTSKYLVTTTQYRQDFPFVGRAAQTVIELESALQPDPCNASPGDSCFTQSNPSCGTPGHPCPRPGGVGTESIGVGGQVLSNAADTYTSNPVFAPGTVVPVMPYMSGSDEQKFDVVTAGALSHEITSSFTDDKYGNITSSSIISSESSGIDETKTTTNIFGCTLAPPKPSTCVGGNLNAEWQRLGRLSIATVVSSRAGQTANTRRASFEYDTATLLRVAEIQGPYDDLETDPNVLKTLGLRADLVRDADGNVVEQVQCSTSHFANRGACTSLTGFQQRQFPTDLSKVQRYAKWDIESLGRFELDKKVPFYSATGIGNTNENIAEYVGIAIAGTPGPAMRSPGNIIRPDGSLNIVVNRDAFGNPLNRVDSVGNVTSYVYGLMGRAYFSEQTTGPFSRATYIWCQDVSNTDIPTLAPRANCPTGAVYGIVSDSVASVAPYAGQSVAPTGWGYFDSLGREVLRTKRIYQPDPVPPSKLHWSSVSTTYDSTGRLATISTPYFSVDPTAAQTTARAGTVQTGAVSPATSTTTYDAADRATDQSHPEESTNGASDSKWNYATLTTNATNPRTYVTKEVRNARDEVIQVNAPNGQTNALTVNYTRDAVGNLTAVKRTPTDGNSAGTLITTSMGYDRIGRKTSMTDPDKGAWTYGFNALGEQITQTDAKGQTQSLFRDALGRLYQRNENRLSSGTFVSEPTSTWEYDTAVRPGDLSASLAGTILLGSLKTESNGIGGFSRTTNYDDIGRVISVASTLDGTVYTESQTYDQFSRPYQHFDASTSASSANGELTDYSTDGYPIDTREASGGTTGTMYDQVLGLSQRGQVKTEQHHSNAALETDRTFDDNTGRVLTISSNGTTLQNWSYDYDKHSNMLHRWNHATSYNLREDFTYDDLDRLHTLILTLNGTAQPTLTVGYDQIGNLTSKTLSSTTQTWTYGSQPAGCSKIAGPHAASQLGTSTYCYDANGNQISATFSTGTRAITYTGYDLPAQIQTTYPSVATESFAYAPDRSMWKRVEGTSSGTSDNIFCNGFDTSVSSCPAAGSTPTTYFVDNVEFRVSGATTTTKRNIGGYLVVSTTSTNGGSPSSPTYRYLFRDAVGSIDVITNETAVVQQRQAFDAWGNRRDATAGGGWGILSAGLAASFDTSITFEGFTGHQQLDPVGLIHMKGRLYDPALGRFIQADPMTESDATQGLNRYSYVLNNPLSLSDPSGYLSFRQILGIAIGVVAACFGQWEISEQMWGWALATSVAGGFLSAYVATGSVRAGLWGAFAGGVFFGIGSYFSQFQGAAGSGFMGSGFTTGAFAANVAAHAAAGGVLNDLQGGNFGSGFLSAGATEALSPAIDRIGNAPARVMTAAMVGGTVSKAAGGRFANGAVAAAFSYAFSSLAPRLPSSGPSMSDAQMAAAAYGDPAYYTADVLVDIGEQRTDSSNFLGHVSSAVTDGGLYSFGTGGAGAPDLGVSATDFISDQSQYRTQVIYLVSTTSEQDAQILQYLSSQSDIHGYSGYIDNCAYRTSSALMAGGVMDYTSVTPAGVNGAMINLVNQGQATRIVIPQNSQIPDFSTFNKH